MSVFSKIFAPSKAAVKLREDRIDARSGNIATRQDAMTDRTSITGELPGQQWADTATSLGADASSALSSIYGHGVAAPPVAAPPAAPPAPPPSDASAMPSWVVPAGLGFLGVVGLVLATRK